MTELKPIKPLSMMTEDELILYRENQRLSETLRWDNDIMGLLNQKIEQQEQELKSIRASTLYNFSEYMHRHHIWIGKFGTFLVGLATTPITMYMLGFIK